MMMMIKVVMVMKVMKVMTMMVMMMMMTMMMPRPRKRTPTWCEPAQSKRVSKFDKSHYMQKFTGKMLLPRVSTLIKHLPLELYRKNPSV